MKEKVKAEDERLKRLRNKIFKLGFENVKCVLEELIKN